MSPDSSSIVRHRRCSIGRCRVCSWLLRRLGRMVEHQQGPSGWVPSMFLIGVLPPGYTLVLEHGQMMPMNHTGQCQIGTLIRWLGYGGRLIVIGFIVSLLPGKDSALHRTIRKEYRW